MDKSSRVQGSLLPGGRETDVVVTAVAAPVADAETLGIEAADVDVVAVRVKTRCPDVDVLEESDTTNLVVGRDEPAHLGSVRNRFQLGEELVLLSPGLRG